MGVIYKHTCLITGLSYIGKTKNTMKQRLNEHIRNSKKPNYGHFHNALNKYGIDNFISEVLVETDDNSKLNELEIFYINLHDTYNNGYNSTKGGDGGAIRIGMKNSDSQKLKSSKAQLGKTKNNPGECGKYKKSSEHKAKISETISGSIWVKNLSLNLSLQVQQNNLQEYIEQGYVLGRLGNIGAKKGCKGPSEEQRLKISETLRNKPKVECVHCGKIGSSAAMNRYHFDNCKHKIKLGEKQ